MKYITPDWPVPAHIKAYTTSKHGWGGRTPHHDHHQGNISHDPDCMQASQQLIDLLDLPAEPIWIQQTHSTIAIPALSANKETKADASFTTSANHVCAVLSADCLPILICNQEGTAVAAIHAGWRGLAAGIIDTTLAQLNQPPETLLVWLGPAIGPNKFEVGKEVFDAFTHNHAQSKAAFIAQDNEKWHADLYQLAKIRLQEKGISQIYGGNFCTYSQDDLFFSYRRDKGKTGRMASLIWIEKKK